MNPLVHSGSSAQAAILLLALAVVATAVVAAIRVAHRAGILVEPLLWRCLLIGLASARVAFVIRSPDAYLASPLDILDLSDGGWSPVSGLAVSALYAIAAAARLAVRKQPLGAVLGTLALVWTVGTVGMAARASSGMQLPALSFAATDGRTVALTDFSGKPTVVNLWASWCPPCRREMPVLQQAQAEHAGVHFVFLNQGESAETVQTYLDGQKLTLGNVLLDTLGEAAPALGAQGLPTTLFFDARGRLVDVRAGELSSAELASRLATLSPPAKADEPTGQ